MAGGYGATCKYHTNARDQRECKTNLSVQSMSPEDARCYMKLGLLAGLDIDEDDPCGQQRHIQIKWPQLTLRPEAEIDRDMEKRLRDLDKP